MNECDENMGAPGFAVCIGASKAGTTTLHSMLAQHPEVAVTKVKESNFFYDSAAFSRGFPWYVATYFDQRPGTRLLFEADPAYQVHRRCHERIRSVRPDARIVLMMRNPIERAFSQYLYRLELGRERLTFEEVCRREPDRIASGGDAVNLHGYLERSRYGKYIAYLLEVFPRERVHFILFERFVADPVGEFDALVRWLGLTPHAVEPIWDNETVQARSRALGSLLYDGRWRGLRRLVSGPLATVGLKGRALQGLLRLNYRRYDPARKPRLTPEMRHALAPVFAADIDHAERLTGLDLSIWRPESVSEGVSAGVISCMPPQEKP